MSRRELASTPRTPSAPPRARSSAMPASPAIDPGERLVGVAVALLVTKLVLSLPLLARAGGAEIGFLPELTVSDALRTIGLWLVATWLVQRRSRLGWAMALTITAIAGVTAVTTSGANPAWSSLSLATSAALLVALLVPATVRTFFHARRGSTPAGSATTTHPAPTDPRGTES